MVTQRGAWLGVFAKFWEPGQVKTRLAGKIGSQAAAKLYRLFLETTLERLEGLAERHELCYWPPDRKQEFRELVPLGWEIAPQRTGDLGERIEAFFERAFASGASRVVLIGSDTPTLPRRYVEQALECLVRVPVTLGPTVDGGYYLVGGRSEAPPIFRGIAWSTPAVWQQTIDALEESGLQPASGFATTPVWYDVDTLEDLFALRRELAASSNSSASLLRLADAIEAVLANRSGQGSQ